MDWDEFLDECIPEPDTVVVEAPAASGSHGPRFATAVGVPNCIVQDGVKQVRVQTGGASGQSKVSTCQVLAPPDASIPAGSRVTLPSGRVTFVLTSDVLTDNGLELPEHLELMLE